MKALYNIGVPFNSNRKKKKNHRCAISILIFFKKYIYISISIVYNHSIKICISNITLGDFWAPNYGGEEWVMLTQLHVWGLNYQVFSIILHFSLNPSSLFSHYSTLFSQSFSLLFQSFSNFHFLNMYYDCFFVVYSSIQ